ncbi:MAG: EpsG family protein, partial [Cetobacterium sp.]|uniref:EpsG family protein n=2 Tax=Cetobacterium sp. TaxID=2071632 RepID=UPI003EE5B0E9
MVQYIYILIFNLILAKYFKEIKNFSLIIITLSFTLFFSLRWGVGTDFYNYYTGFFRYGVLNIEVLLRKDSLFYFLVKILYMITNKNYVLYQFIVGFLIYFPLIYIYKKKSNSFENTIFFFQTLTIAFFPLNGVRQALAGSLGLVSIYFYTKSPNKLKSLIFFILAVSIHNSAIILLLIPILIKIKPNKKNIIKIIILFTILLIFFEKVYTLGINSFVIFGNQKMISDYGNLKNLRKGVNLLTILFQFFPIILYYIFYKKYISKKKYIYINSSI